MREEVPPLSDALALELAEQLLASDLAPDDAAARQELRDKARQALALLKEGDREVLVLRFLERLSTADTAAVLGGPAVNFGPGLDSS